MLLEKWLLTVQPSTGASSATLYMFGNNSFGQLGNNSINFGFSPALIGTSSWTQISAGNSHTIAIRSDRTLWGWGYNNVGQLGNNDRSLINRSAPIQISTSSWNSISTNGDTTYAIRNDGSLFAWGLNLAGQMGNNQAISLWARNSWTSLAAGPNYAAGLDSTGAMWTWGRNNVGQLGQGDAISRSSPTQVGTSSWTVVGANKAIRADGALFTWSTSPGNNTTVQLSSPIQVGSLFTGSFQTAYATSTGKTMASWTTITASGGIQSNGSLWLWGTNVYGEVGDGTTINRSSPVQIGTSSWTTIAQNIGSSTIVAIRSDSTIWAWGNNSAGQLGLNDRAHRSSPVQITSVSGSWTNVVSGGNPGQVLARLSDGSLYGWGNNQFAQLGIGDTVNRSTPVQIIATGIGPYFTTARASAAIRTDGALLAWGYNLEGQLGLNDQIHRSSPVQVGTSSWSLVSASQFTTTAIRSDGGLFTWGGGVSNGLAIGTTINRSSPVQVTSLNTAALQQAYLTTIGVTPTLSWTILTGGFMQQGDTSGTIFGIKSDGSLWGWGRAAGGWLGQGDTIDRSSPVQIGTSSWTSVGIGYSFAAAIRSDGALFTWGLGTQGQLGQGDTISRSSPIQIGTSSWTIVSSSWQNMAALRTDGTLWSWGAGTSGAIGDGTTIGRSSPIQIGAATNWTNLSSYGGSAANTFVINNTGALWGWGVNSSGSLGLGDTLARSSPVQIGTSSWSQVSAGWIATAAIRSDGGLFMWGNNVSAQLGDGTVISKSSPIQIGTQSWNSISAGVNTFARRSDNYVFAWGYNVNGQVGINSSGAGTNVSSPTMLVAEGAVNIAPSVNTPAPNTWRYIGSQNAGIDSNGNGFVWGPNGTGQLGQLTFGAGLAVVPTFIRIGTIYDSWTQVSSEVQGSFAIRNDNTLWAWGNNTSGVLGLNNTTVQTSMQLVGTSSWSQVVSGTDSRAAALSNNNQLWRWGSGGTGQLGDGTAITKSSPTQVAASYNRDSWNFIGSISNTQGVIRSDGALFMFPASTSVNNNAGQMGDGTTISKSNPVQIPVFNASWISIVGGGFFGSNAGIKSDGSLWTWGSNTFGQLGDGTTINKSSPVQISSSSYVVVSGDETKFGITTAGTLIGWGANQNGQLGLGDTINRSGASQIGSSLWVAISSRGSAGNGATGAIRVDGQLFTWGRNNEGQLGAGTTISRSSPVQVGSGIWNKISSGRLSMYVINGAGSLFAWGDGSTGQLGDGTTISKSSPVQIGTSSWIMVSTNSSFSVGAIRKDSALFTWGANGSFQLGLGDGNPRSSPTQVGTSSWSIVNANEAGMAAIRIDSKLFTWGGNSSGTVGDGTTVNRNSPVQIGTSSWVDVGGTGMGILLEPGYTTNSPVTARGNFYTVPGGQLYAWGDNTNGELGIFNTQNKSSPVQLGLSSWTSVSSGASYAMAIRSDGQLFGWGSASSYQIGDYTLTSRSNPVQISIPFNAEFVNLSWIQVSAGGGSTTLAIDSNRALWGWGSSSSGQLGQGTVATVSGPTLISSLFTYDNEVAYATATGKTRLSWSSVGSGFDHVVAVKGNKLFTWGQGSGGVLGLGDTIARSSPVQVGTSSWTAVAAADDNSMAIRSDGGLFTWGRNSNGELGDGTVIGKSSPVQIGTSSWAIVSVGYSGSAAIRSDGSLYVWGYNTYGQLGQDNTLSRSSPVQVGTSSWSMVDTNGSTALAIRKDGSLFAWGTNSTGDLGNNATTARSSPIQIGTSSWSMISVGSVSTGIKSDFTLWTWGYNFAGALGLNDTIHRSSPVQLTSLSTPTVQASYLTSVSKTGFSWTFVSNGGGSNQGNSFAIRNDGRLFGWGSGSLGQIGDSTTVQKFSPVAIGTSSWSQVSVGQSFVMAIRNDGALFTWGNNGSGVLGLLDFVHRSSPVQVGTSSWIAICAGGYPAVGGSALAIRLDGSLYAWGRNDFGQIGDLTRTAKSSPVQIGTSSWTSLGSMGTSGVYGSMAIRSDGGLFTWGYNLNGQLGLNDTTHRSSPVQVGTSSWSVISGMAESPAAIRLDGGLFAWGINTTGAVGDGTTTQRNSPVKIGTSSWVTVTAFNIGNGGHHAKRSDGLLFAWGTAGRYTLGDGSLSTNSSSPVVITSGIGSSIVNISSAGGAALSIDPTGQLWAWGIGSYGENSRNPSYPLSTSLPTFIPSVNDSWIFVNGGSGAVTGAVRLDGSLFAWGNGSNWALGDGTSVHRSLPVQIGTGNSWSSAVWGSLAGFAITSNSQGNALFSWGRNLDGEIGNNTTISPASSPIFIRSINESWTSISSSGPSSSLGVRSDGTLWSWGSGASGQIADGTTINRSRPTQIGTDTNWTQVYTPSDSGNSGYALNNSSIAWAWGSNSFGELGLTVNPSSVTGTWLLSRSSPVQIGATPFSASPTQIGTSSWSSVSAGTTHALAVRSNGSLFAWGVNDNQQLGDNSNIAKSSPVQIGTSSWNVVSAGNVHSLAIANDNSLYGWGLRYQPFVYDYAINSSNNFLLTQNNLSWSQLQTGQSNSIALRSDGAMFVWGQAAGGALNLPDVQTQLLSPTQVGSSSWTFVMNRGSGYGGAAIRNDGALFVWGSEVPNNTSIAITYSSPIQIGTSSWTMIGLRGLSARRIDGALFTWGDNTYGQLGDFTTISRSSPVQIGTSSWTFVGYGCAIRSDGSLFSWGYNAYGTQGLGDTLRRSSPTQVGTSSWTMVATYGQNSDIAGAIRSDGGLFTWGNNFGGQLGLNDTTHRSSPVQVGTSSWTMVTVPQTGLSAPSGAIRSDGSLFTWGNTSTGDNTTTSRSSPVQIGTSSWTTVSSGQYGVQALRLDKSLWAWGNSQGGGVGGAVYASFTLLGTRSSPVQLPSYQNVPGKLGTLAWSRISAGYSHSVGVLTDGKLYGFGTMAAGNFTPYSWSQISASTSSSGAIRSDGALYMWGLNSSGQLGQNNVINPTVQLQVGTSSWIQVASIENGGATMAIRSDGGLFTWGSGGGGQLGDDTSINRSSPVQIGTSSWSMVGGDSKAIRSNGSLFSWGRNNNGEVGDGTTIHRSSPVQIGTSSWSTVSSKSGSGNFSLAIRSDGSLFSWGRDSNGGLGDGTTISRSSPVQIGTSSWSMVSALAGSIALRSDYSLWVWGNNSTGQLGQFDIINRSSPVQVSSLGVNEVSNSYYFATTGQIRRKWIKQGQNAFINDDNKLWNFGAGDGTTITKRSLVQLGTSSWTMIGYQGAIRSDGTLWMWESGAGAQWGANGDGTTIRRSSPVQVSTGGSWAQIAGAGSVSVAISSNGTLWAWGINSSGQLGDGTTINRSNPVQIGTSSWTAVAAMTLTVAAIRADGTLWAWGNGSAGILSQADTLNRSSPVQIGTSSWTAIAAGSWPNNDNGIIAIRSDGALFTWGNPSSGISGDNNLIHRSSPVQIGTSSWTAVAAGTDNRFALRKDGSLWGWGNNANGQVGDGTTISKSSPVQIGTSSWSQLGSSGYYAFYLTGELYGWTSGQSGNIMPLPGNPGPTSSPVFITANTDDSWTSISSAGGANMGLRKDGMLFTWGSNAFGELGDGTTINRSGPVQIGPNQSTPWVLNSINSIAAGNSTGYVINNFPGRSIFAWGIGTNYRLAQNQITGGTDQSNRSSPVQIGTNTTLAPFIMFNSPSQIGTSSWSQVSAELNYNLAISSNGGVFRWGYNDNAPVAGITSTGITANTVSSNQISAGPNNFGILK